jgi:transposase
MVMTSCLMVYAALEHKIRKTLKEKTRYFPDQKKLYKTLPHVGYFNASKKITLLYQQETGLLVLNLNERQRIIIECLGERYRQIYS